MSLTASRGILPLEFGYSLGVGAWNLGFLKMTVPVHFYSYFKDLTGCAETSLEVVEHATLNELVGALCKKFPKWSAMQNSTLIAVGVEYQTRDYVLRTGDEVSLFPPVQGG